LVVHGCEGHLDTFHGLPSRGYDPTVDLVATIEPPRGLGYAALWHRELELAGSCVVTKGGHRIGFREEPLGTSPELRNWDSPTRL
jgi:hypothetical protein